MPRTALQPRPPPLSVLASAVPEVIVGVCFVLPALFSVILVPSQAPPFPPQAQGTLHVHHLVWTAASAAPEVTVGVCFLPALFSVIIYICGTC